MKDAHGFDRMRIDEVEIRKVIWIKYVRGDGTHEDPVRTCNRFYTLEGELIIDTDEIRKMEKEYLESQKKGGVSS